jgi:MarR family transcriptional regulator, organic hydroperoxide resistance regulator
MHDLLPLNEHLCFALYSTSLTMTKVYKPLLKPLGLTYPQYLVMLTLWEQDQLTVSMIGEALYLDSGTLTPLLKNLEAQGFLTRTRSASDERKVMITLTPLGKATKRRAASIPRCIAEASATSVSELGELNRRLQALRESLQAPRPAAPPRRKTVAPGF